MTTVTPLSSVQTQGADQPNNPRPQPPRTHMATGMDPAESLRVASEGYDLLFANDLVGAVDLFSADRYYDSPFHIMGLGVCAFLKAALGMEVCCSAVMFTIIYTLRC
jgi:hypothetical protein